MIGVFKDPKVLLFNPLAKWKCPKRLVLSLRLLKPLSNLKCVRVKDSCLFEHVRIVFSRSPLVPLMTYGFLSTPRFSGADIADGIIQYYSRSGAWFRHRDSLQGTKWLSFTDSCKVNINHTLSWQIDQMKVEFNFKFASMNLKFGSECC